MSQRMVSALFAASLFGALDAAAAEPESGRGRSEREGRLERVRFTDVDSGNRVEIAFILNLLQARAS